MCSVFIFLILNNLITVAHFQSPETDINLDKITEQLVSYQRCRVDSDCRKNSFCFDNDNNRVGLCKCQAGYELLQRNSTFYTCKTLSKWNEDCDISEQCVDNLGSFAACLENKCSCQTGSVRYPYDGRCYASRILGDACITDANCALADGSYAFCAEGKCECNVGMCSTKDGKRCVAARNLAEQCTEDIQCNCTENAICRNLCRCSIGYVISQNASSCLKAAIYFGDPCIENTQCSEFLVDSVCVEGKCECELNYHNYKNQCIRTKKMGELCEASKECEKNNECLERICRNISNNNNNNSQHISSYFGIILLFSIIINNYLFI